MLLLALLALAGVCAAQNVDDSTEQKDAFFIAMENPFMRFHGTDEFPDRIEYLQMIFPNTGLMVRVIYGDEDDDTKNTLLNLCKLLDNALFDPESSEARYNMASHFGLTGTTCPIEVGTRPLLLYEFPIEVTTKNSDCGVKYYHLKVQARNETQNTETIMELRVPLASSNETCIENSSGILSAPSIATSIVVALLLFGVIY